jgi:hypothetical protein
LDHSTELAWATRLSGDQAKLWATNLAVVLGPAANVSSAPAGTNGWQWQIGGSSETTSNAVPAFRTFQLVRARGWTVIGLAAQSNSLAADFANSIQRDGAPFSTRATNFWLEADIDLQPVAGALAAAAGLSNDLPTAYIAMTGDTQGVHTQAHLDFPKPLPATLQPWNIPTNLIHEPLVSFTAIRNIGPWLSSTKFWSDLQVGPAPDQLYLWGQGGLPFLSYFAVPFANASNLVGRLGEKLVQQANPWIETNGLGRFEWATNFDGVVWSNLSITTPYLKALTTPQGGFAFAGLERDFQTNPPPAELFQAIAGRTNVVMYDWELTGPRIEQWLYFGQFLRYVLHKAQIPAKSASFAWLTVMSHRLGNSGTTLTRTGPNRLTFGRTSGIGLTSAEMDWLADWLESPQFPRGLNTFVGQPEPLPLKLTRDQSPRNQTNSLPPPRPRAIHLPNP